MPRSKRKTARKSMPGPDTSDLDFPDSSPSRPFAKRPRISSARSSARRRRASPAHVDHDDGDDEVELDDELSFLPNAGADDGDNDDDDDDDESEVASQGDLVDTVVQSLTVSKDAVAVAHQHANELSTDTSKINAYAKVAGRTWTYYIREQSINLGRPPDDRQTATAVAAASSPLADLKEMMPVHIDLGPSKIVSRHHASIFYDAEVPDGGGWHVRVNGRNGVRVNNILLKRGTRQQITSGTILEIAGTQMMFVTANDPVQIATYFVDQAKTTAGGGGGGDDVAPLPPSHHPVHAVANSPRPLHPSHHAHPEPALRQQLSSASSAASSASTTYPSLAPAPPDYKRTATTPPPQSEPHSQHGVFDSKAALSPMYGRGMMMESTQEIDYSRDSAKDLKPPFSYATMIAQAIFSSQEEKLTLSNIYSFIADKYAFYRHSNSGWQNSIRHNLSLNKAFQKVPRRTDEPGKGMKWQIAPEFRSEFYKKQAKRPGSNPSSPASSKEVNPNFRGPNGQNLGYDTSMVSSFSAKDGPQGGGGGPNPHFQVAPPSAAAAAAAAAGYPLQLADTSTPVRRRRADTGATQPDVFDDSPAHERPHANGGAGGAGQQPVYTLPSAHLSAHSPPTASLNATLSSSYLDTPFHPSQSSLLTPAPLRQNPRLAPPSTLVAPSKFMPESSPAGPTLFWKGIMGITPGAPVADMSPVKGGGGGGGGSSVQADRERERSSARLNGGEAIDRGVMSSSPPPMDGNESPTKVGRPAAAAAAAVSVKELRDGDGDTFMRSRSTSMAHAAAAAAAPPPPGLLSLHPHPHLKAPGKDDDGDGGGGVHNDAREQDDDGFDLAKGFAPIAATSMRAAR